MIRVTDEFTKKNISRI